MVSNTPNPNLQLLPERHPQDDLFICDVADAVLKDVMPADGASVFIHSPRSLKQPFAAMSITVIG